MCVTMGKLGSREDCMLVEREAVDPDVVKRDVEVLEAEEPNLEEGEVVETEVVALGGSVFPGQGGG